MAATWLQPPALARAPRAKNIESNQIPTMTVATAIAAMLWAGHQARQAALAMHVAPMTLSNIITGKAGVTASHGPALGQALLVPKMISAKDTSV
jgi:hypothetical protein